MTVTYTAEVATCRGFGTFLRLLWRWRGSIYKLVWLDLLVFLLFYYVLNFTYRVLLEEDQKRIFEGIVQYCRSYVTVIPIAFVLGFYVTVVMNRWWGQYTSIPKPDSIAVFISTNIHGQDERGRVMRRTIMRYVCLCATMVLTMISPKVKKRFPTMEHLVEAGLLLENELLIIESMNKKFPKHAKHWMPIVWAAGIVTRARKEGRVRDDFAVKTIIDEMNKFRGQCGLLISYDNISVPLVYTQVVTIAVYSYFVTSAMGRQWTEVNLQSQTYVANVDIYFPIFTTLEFFFYMGWLKVAESLINPFGDDDDDFEVSWMIDRNLQVSYLIVDEMHHEHPELLKDQYWDDVYPAELPYTMATDGQREKAPEPSTAKIDVPVRQQGIVTNSPSVIKIDQIHKQNDNQTVSYKFAPPENQDALSGVHVTADGRKVQSSNLNSISRVSSVASIMKRIFTKDDQNQNQPLTTPPISQSDGNISPFALSASNASLGGKVPFGSKKLATDVIEEVDEQNTITSMATKKQENRPTADSVFATGSSTSSQPVQIPTKRTRVASQKDDIISSSAPSRWSRLSLPPVNNTGGDSISLQPQTTYDSNFDSRPRLDSDIGPCLSAAVSRTMENDTETDELLGDGDEFEKLKSIREKERKGRYLQKMLARSISGQQNASGDNLDNDLLLKELVSPSQSQTEQEINKDSQNKTAS